MLMRRPGERRFPPGARGPGGEWGAARAPLTAVSASPCDLRNATTWEVQVGLDDMIVVRTPDATLVARRDQEAAIRQIVKQLGERDWREYL